MRLWKTKPFTFLFQTLRYQFRLLPTPKADGDFFKRTLLHKESGVDLLVDIGNQNLKWMAERQLGRFPSCDESFEQNLVRNFAQIDEVRSVLFVSVKGHRSAHSLSQFTARAWGVEAQQVTAGKYLLGVHNPDYDPAELGADRWAALIGAWSVTRQACVIVDCGTAITVDAVNDDGRFIGGSILPGFSLSLTALGQNTAHIAEPDKLSPTLPALSTAQAVSSGVVYGTVCAADELVRRYLSSTGSHAKLLLTGGDANWVLSHSRFEFDLFPQLVLQGLAEIAAHRSFEKQC